MLEPLENRRLFSAVLNGKVLTIAGTARSDDIAIAAGKKTFVVQDNGIEYAFDVAKVKSIRITGGRGDDSIIVSPRLAIRCSIEAGPGNDRVGGGAGHDTIFGQQGNDTIAGNDGMDYLDGGGDDDYLLAGNIGRYGASTSHDPDVLHGGAGADEASIGYEQYGSGIESVSGLGFNSPVSLRSEIRSANGRLLVTINEIVADRSRVQWNEPATNSDGRTILRFRLLEQGEGINDVHTAKTYDITDAAGSGIEYETYLPWFETPVTSFVLLLPRK